MEEGITKELIGNLRDFVPFLLIKVLPNQDIVTLNKYTSNIFDWIADNYEESKKRIISVANNNKFEWQELELIQANGAIKHFHVYKIAIDDNSMIIVGVGVDVLTVDIKELEYVKMALEYVSDHIVITDSDGVITYINKAAENTTGYLKDEVVGKKVGSKSTWGGLMEDEFYKALWNRIKYEKKVFQGEIKNRRKNGEVYEVSVTITPILDAKGEVLLFVGVEKDLTALNFEKDLALVISHETYNSLNSITKKIESCITSLTKEGKVDHVENAYNSINDLQNKVMNLIRANQNVDDYSQMYNEEFSINELIDNIINEIREDNNSIEINLNSADNDSIYSNKELVKMVIKNIVENATIYSDNNGVVSIDVSKKRFSFEIDVHNNGIAIPNNTLHLIGTKFYRTERAKEKYLKGLGLGLYVAKILLAKIGGRFDIVSSEQEGTKVKIIIPF